MVCVCMWVWAFEPSLDLSWLEDETKLFKLEEKPGIF
jgi:hypothetical protein